VLPCVEDDPCWDCRTMGNRRCGRPADGQRLYVHPTGIAEQR
jgi:hypothetical protein